MSRNEEIWHINQSHFDQDKKDNYFIFKFANVPAFIQGFKHHYPCSKHFYMFNETEVVCPQLNKNPHEIFLEKERCISNCLQAIKYMAKRNLVPHIYTTSNDMQLGFDVVVLGPKLYQHSLVPGDLIIVDDGTGYSLMPDERRWKRNDSDVQKMQFSNIEAQPYLCTFKEKYIDEDNDGDELVSYIVIREDGTEKSIDPHDIVKNVRAYFQHVSACTIQRSWRLRKKVASCIVIQRAWKHTFYACEYDFKGKGFLQSMNDFKALI